MPKYYLLDENKNLVEGFDKEGFLALLEQAIEQGSLEDIDEDSAVASKLRSALNGTTHHIEFVTQAQYNQLVAQGQLVGNTYYFITDDATAEDLENAIQSIIDGTISVRRATNADSATNATNADNADNALSAGYARTTDVSNAWVECNTSSVDLTYQKCDCLLIDYGTGGAHMAFFVTNDFRANSADVVLMSSICESGGHKYQFSFMGSNQNNTLHITYVRVYRDGSEITSTAGNFRIKPIH